MHSCHDFFLFRHSRFQPVHDSLWIHLHKVDISVETFNKKSTPHGIQGFNPERNRKNFMNGKRVEEWVTLKVRNASVTREYDAVTRILYQLTFTIRGEIQHGDLQITLKPHRISVQHYQIKWKSIFLMKRLSVSLLYPQKLERIYLIENDSGTKWSMRKESKIRNSKEDEKICGMLYQATSVIVVIHASGNSNHQTETDPS